MFYKTIKGTKTYKAIKEVDDRANKAIETAGVFVEKFGEKKWVGFPWSWGGVSSVVFENGPVPTDWIKSKNTRGYKPHKNRKSVKETRKEMDSLPRVDHIEMGRACGMNKTPYIVGGRMIEGPSSVFVGEEFAIFKISEKLIDLYVTPEDVKEITSEEYKEKTSQIQADEHRKKVDKENE